MNRKNFGEGGVGGKNKECGDIFLNLKSPKRRDGQARTRCSVRICTCTLGIFFDFPSRRPLSLSELDTPCELICGLDLHRIPAVKAG